MVTNYHDYKSVKNKANQEIVFDPDTKANVSIDKLINVLNSSAYKFINIGRFSFEKGHLDYLMPLKIFTKKIVIRI